MEARGSRNVESSGRVEMAMALKFVGQSRNARKVKGEFRCVHENSIDA